MPRYGTKYHTRRLVILSAAKNLRCFVRRGGLSMTLWGALLALGGTCLLAACGAQGPPQPPRIERPERVTDLAATQIGRSLEISFTLPRLAEDGQRLTKPLEVSLLRAILAPGGRANSGEKLGLWLTWQAADLTRHMSGEKVIYQARLSDEEFNRWCGDTFELVLRTLTRGFRRRPIESDSSNPVAITLLNVSEAVKGLQVITTEKALELRWNSPERSLSHRPLTGFSGYRIYRSTTSEKGPFVLAGESSSLGYEDRDFIFGRTYSYRVQAVFREDSQTAESEGSQTLTVTPMDTFPPAAPTGLTVAYAGGTADVVWSANHEPDLAGYNVYRREKDTAPVRVNKELAKIPLFHDSAVQPGHEYFYKVTAVDLAQNESAASAEASVQTQ